jgi:hypothetical protein
LSWPQIVVASLKAEIAAVTETPVNRQRLIFQGKVLKDEDKISAYGAALGLLASVRTSRVNRTVQYQEGVQALVRGRRFIS